MSTLFEALSSGSYDLQNKRDLSSDFARKLLEYRNTVVSEFLKFNIDLNKAIANIAKKENLNDDEIQRIIEEVNNQVYLIKYDKTKGSNVREVEFNIAYLQGVKNAMKGEYKGPESNGDEESKDKPSIKTAFETKKLDTMEKVASFVGDNQSESGIFNGMLSHRYGSLGTESKYTRDEVAIAKISKIALEKEAELNDNIKQLKYKSGELADTFIQLERLGSEPKEVLATLVKYAGLNLNEVNIIKDSINDNLTMKKEAHILPSDFKVSFQDISLKKKASEKYTLGKYSLQKKASVVCDTNIPKIMLSSGRYISSIEDIMKLASEYKECVAGVEKSNEEYLAIREKCASIGIDADVIEDANYSPYLVDTNNLIKQAEELSNEEPEVEKTAGVMSAINKLQEMISSSNSVTGALLGTGKKQTGAALNKATKARDMLESAPKAQFLKKQISQTGKDINGIKKSYAKKVSDVNKNKEIFNIRNNQAIKRESEQGALKNLFDKEVRNVRKQRKAFDKDIKSIQKEKLKDTRIADLKKKRDGLNADLTQYYDRIGLDKANDSVNQAQKMYSKAVRRTNLARGGVGAGVGVMGLKKLKNNNTQPQNSNIEPQDNNAIPQDMMFIQPMT